MLKYLTIPTNYNYDNPEVSDLRYFLTLEAVICDPEGDHCGFKPARTRTGLKSWARHRKYGAFQSNVARRASGYLPP